MRTLIILIAIMGIFTRGCNKTEPLPASTPPRNDSVAVRATINPADTSKLYSQVFRNIEEIPGFENYRTGGGGLIDYDHATQRDYKYAIADYHSANNSLVALELLIPQPDGKSHYKILDMVNIGRLGKNEQLTYSTCMQDTTYNQAIIAVVNIGNSEAYYDTEYFDTVIRAWRADTTTGKIIRIDDVKNIKCANEGYGAD